MICWVTSPLVFHEDSWWPEVGLIDDPGDAPIPLFEDPADPLRQTGTRPARAAMSCLIPSKPNGRPMFNWTLAFVACSDMSEVNAHSRVQDLLEHQVMFDQRIPFLGQTGNDLGWSRIKQQRVNNRIIDRGVDDHGLGRSSRVRDYLLRSGRRLEETFEPTRIHAGGHKPGV